MKRTIAIIIAGSILAAWAVAAPNHVGTRRQNQQSRIAQGVRSGSLTAGETANLERKESAINQEVRTDRSLNGGRLTGQERQIINGQQNRMSNQIYRDKNNTATQYYGSNQVDARRYNQQQRVAGGIASGRLTAGETSRLEGGEAAINRETWTDRAANGGRLTPGERSVINGQQSVLSGKIYQDKHN